MSLGTTCWENCWTPNFIDSWYAVYWIWKEEAVKNTCVCNLIVQQTNNNKTAIKSISTVKEFWKLMTTNRSHLGKCNLTCLLRSYTDTKWTTNQKNTEFSCDLAKWLREPEEKHWECRGFYPLFIKQNMCLLCLVDQFLPSVFQLLPLCPVSSSLILHFPVSPLQVPKNRIRWCQM